MQVVFSHGKESGPWGGKITALAEVASKRGLAVESLDYRGMDDPGRRVNKLREHLRGLGEPAILVGSSMGGHVAAAAANVQKTSAVFLMAPAFYMPGYEELTPGALDCPTTIVHGWHDTVVPVENVLRYAREAACTLHLLNADHRMLDNLDELRGLFGLFLDSLALDSSAAPKRP
jgi:pimeloyl-ACP methyl ester carboxylesterase